MTFYPREKADIERSLRLSAPANPTSTDHWPSFFMIVLELCRSSSKGLSVLRLEFVVFGVTKNDTAKCGRQTQSVDTAKAIAHR